MSDVRNPDPPADDLPDPEEDELIAYLDGELDPADARRVEDRIDEDAAYRARADALKKTYDLLDYLPRPEPSPTFATRTLDRIPTSRSSPEAAGPAPSGSAALLPAPPPRSWAWAAGVAAAVTLALGMGYFVADTARPYFRPPAKDAADLSFTDVRVIENLPLYAVADDAEFVNKLADADLFGDDYHDRPGPAAAEKPSARQLDQLTKAFRALPPEQQARVRELDRQLNEKEPAERARLFRSLESYAAWLDRLPDAERKGVLSAATPGLRLGVVQDLREKQWMDSLPEAIRNHADVKKRPELVKEWKEREADRRRAWAFARRNWESFQKNDPPWPFKDPALKKDVMEFVRTAFRTDARADERPRCRLTPQELNRLRAALAEAEQAGGWAWREYGQMVYDVAHRPPLMLPEPASGKMVLDPDDLWPKAKEHFHAKGPQKRAMNHVGKWPDFALHVWEEARGTGKKSYTIPAAVTLGPCRPDEFKPPVRDVIKVLEKKAPAEREALKKLEGKWPEYPRELLRAARAHDLSVPGVTLPGSPKEWDRLYGPQPPAAKGRAEE